ncbi:gliding motility-associated C-terminal domain-containing protein [Spirosoma oryzicola]|uniref:gliding motility-associated C-terminal domain-containing protein n=1 Tax=Spirosoma oryzicola TaxID=2898794 RepID=UPI001E584F2C|nr:gliding motility-associated C-terminal domain-containing protein [Spirosoma oryzicola]UHG90751.1 gliding motility-associated C-terminal domain-containing protein [Spirosoma oryzicola]
MRVLRMWPIGIRGKADWLATFWTSLFLIIAWTANGQTPDNNNYCLNRNGAAEGGFTLEKSKICLGELVRVTKVSPNVSNAGYNYEYGGKGLLVPSTLPTYSYTKPGSYTIIQVGSGGSAGTGTVYCQEVTVLPNEAVKFTVTSCLGRKATLVPDETTLGQYDRYEVYWGDGVREQKTRAELVAKPTHTYNNNVTYTVTVQGLYNPPVTCRSSVTSFPVTPLSATTQPVITALTTVNDNTISLKYQATPGVNILLQQKDASGVFVTTPQSGTAGAFTVQADTKQVQCFQLIYQDACSNSTSAPSEQVCSLVLNAKAASKQNDLSWQPYSGSTSASSSFRSYRILRNDAPVGNVVNQNTTTYSDKSQIECGVQYCYRLETTVGPTIITSAQSCVNGINEEALESIGDIVVTIQDGHPYLVAAMPTSTRTSSYTMLVSRASSSAGPFQQVGTVDNSNTFADQSADPSAASYCYQLSYRNKCGQTSPLSAPVCTVFLSSKSATGVDWTTASPFAPGDVYSYTLEIVDSVNNTKKEIVMGGNAHYEPDPNDPSIQTQRYRVIALSSGGVPSYSNFFTLRRDPKIFVPDAFTPNGDGNNDTFMVKGLYFDRFRLTIYSRWGEVIYSTTDRTKGWDGTINGQQAAAGQYMYQVEVIDDTDHKTLKTGALLLIR